MVIPPVAMLEGGRHTLAIENNGNVYVFDGRGVADLFRIYTDTPHILAGAALADKVVGKGAAALMALGGVKTLHALVLSETALAMLRDAGVQVTYGELVAGIMNRAGTGPCPVESLCRSCRTPQECLPLIASFLSGKS